MSKRNVILIDTDSRTWEDDLGYECPACGRWKVSKFFSYCPYCGIKIEWEEAP